GQERYRREDTKAAIRHFYLAVQLEPDHFWAQCLWAICCMRIRQPSEAKTGLNACLRQDNENAWLYLLRGFASYQIAMRARDLLEKFPLQENLLRPEAELQFQAAEADYRRALNLLEWKPNDELRYALLVNRGVLRLGRRAFEQSASDLQAAIKLN